MDFFEVVTTQRAIRRLKPDPIPDALLRQIMDAAICAPSGGNRQGWRFILVRDRATRARLGELYREAFGELLKMPYYRDAGTAPPDSPAGRLMASARHLSEHLAEAPVIVLACIATDGTKPTLTTGASIYPADVETAALIPLGYPLGRFGRPPRTPVGEVTFSDRWGQAPGW